MRRLIPHPALSLGLFVIWLLLANSVSAGHLLVATALALLLPRICRDWQMVQARINDYPALLAYLALVLWDIVTASFQLAAIVLFMPRSQIRSAWIAIPIELKSPEAITLLAGTITMTPGTVTADMTADGSVLLIHALHAADPDDIRTSIKRRYESRLKRIFNE
jgi:multicomponent K+:H+ antiporter subunit E